MSTTNPYAAPQTAVTPTQTGASNFILATQGQRFINLIVDNIVIQVLSFGVGIVVGLSFVLLEGPNTDSESAKFRIVSAVAGILCSMMYYFVMEAAFGLTLGKLVTGTRVVSMQGSPATFGQIVGRTLCRFIPFEAFSFFGKDAVGWHDSIPKTRVIKSR